MSNEYKGAILFDLEKLEMYEEVTDLDEKQAEIIEVYRKARLYDKDARSRRIDENMMSDLNRQIELRDEKYKAMQKDINDNKEKFEKVAKVDEAIGTLRHAIEQYETK